MAEADRPEQTAACAQCGVVTSCLPIGPAGQERLLCARCQPTRKRRLPDLEAPADEPDRATPPPASR